MLTVRRDQEGMVRDVTKEWAQERIREGLYIVRCTKPGWNDRVRVGAGAINEGAEGLCKRLADHAKPCASTPGNETNKLQPFAEVIRAWALDGWSGDQISDGEKCLWRAIAVRFPKHRGTSRDKSIFVVPTDADLTMMIIEVEADLRLLETVHAKPSERVEVPHVVTAKPRRPRIPRKHKISNLS